MTVAELIATLQRYPPDARVVVDGYECGYDEPQVYVTPAVLCDGGASSYVGQHDEQWIEPFHADTTPVVVVSRSEPYDPWQTPGWAEAVTEIEARRRPRVP